jgi:hypothetical protein
LLVKAHSNRKIIHTQMGNLNFRQHILPHLIAVITFLLIVFIFYRPVFLENKSLRQHDLLQFQGSAKAIIDHREKTGEEALWTNSMFGGMPAYLISVVYDGDLVHHLKTGFSLFLPNPADQSFTAMICFYIMLVIFGVRPYLAITGAIAFGLNSFNLISIEAGHNMKGWAIAYMPLVISGVHLAFNNKKLWGFTLTALALALNFRVNHLQITYYLLLILIIFGLYSFYFATKEKRLPTFFSAIALLVLAALLAFGANLGRLWGVYEYGQYSTRGKTELTAGVPQDDAADGLDRDYVFNWSNGKMETFTLLVPYFKGGGSRESLDMNSNLADALRRNNIPTSNIRETIANAPTYWGDQPFTSGPIYAGAIVVFLFILGIFFVAPKHKYWIITAVVFSIILSWGKNFEVFNYWMYDYFPLYNKFRSVSMAITIALVLMPLLGFMGLEKLISEGLTKNNQKTLLLSAGIAGGISILIALVAGMFSFQGAVDAQLAQYPQWFLNALREDREAMMRSDAFRSFAFILIFSILIFLFLKQKLKTPLAFLLLGLTLLFDMWFVARRYMDSENFTRDPKREFFAETEADRLIKQDQALSFRVYNLMNPFQEARTSYHHYSIGGYHGAKMQRYQDMIERCISPQTNQLIQSLRKGDVSLQPYGSLNMLNARYLLAGTGRDAVILNEHALGNAWFVNEVLSVNNPDEEIVATCNINPAETAVIDVSKFALPNINQEETEGDIILEEFTPNYLRYQANTPTGGLAIFSEIYYPIGWNAFINGEPVEHLRANYILRALSLPAGEHTVEFRFQPQSYYIGNRVMLGFSILLIAVLIGSIIISLKPEQRN